MAPDPWAADVPGGGAVGAHPAAGRLAAPIPSPSAAPTVPVPPPAAERSLAGSGPEPTAAGPGAVVGHVGVEPGAVGRQASVEPGAFVGQPGVERGTVGRQLAVEPGAFAGQLGVERGTVVGQASGTAGAAAGGAAAAGVDDSRALAWGAGGLLDGMAERAAELVGDLSHLAGRATSEEDDRWPVAGAAPAHDIHADERRRLTGRPSGPTAGGASTAAAESPWGTTVDAAHGASHAAATGDHGGLPLGDGRGPFGETRPERSGRGTGDGAVTAASEEPLAAKPTVRWTDLPRELVWREPGTSRH
ncbi:MAG TPA: hypothetical protein VGD67_08775 [Pseudonocardiaceae bacterium]